MEIYKVFYFKKTGRNLTVNYNKRNYTKWGIDWPHKNGCCNEWEIHIGKLHIHSLTPNSNTENK